MSPSKRGDLVKVSLTLHRELLEELEVAVQPTGVLGRSGCESMSAATRRALRELLDRAEAA